MRDRWAREKAARLEQFIPLKYRRTFVVDYEAMLLTHDNAEAVAQWCGGTVEYQLAGMGMSCVTIVRVPGYAKWPLFGEYLVRDAYGKFDIVDAEKFKNYEKVLK